MRILNIYYCTYLVKLCSKYKYIVQWLTYKYLDCAAKNVEITHVYGKDEAYVVIRRSNVNYTNKFGNADDNLAAALENLLK